MRITVWEDEIKKLIINYVIERLGYTAKPNEISFILDDNGYVERADIPIKII